MATPQHKMEEFLSAIVQGQSCVWDAKFHGSMIKLWSSRNKYIVQVNLEEYPCSVREDFIQKVRLACISSLGVASIDVGDEEFQGYQQRVFRELPDGHATLSKDVAGVIKALQSASTTDDQDVRNFMKSASSSTHQIQPKNCVVTHVAIRSILPPQKLKAVCSLITASPSTVKSVFLDTVNSFEHGMVWKGGVFEEMLSTQKGGSCQALESLSFGKSVKWNDTSVEKLGEFLRHTPSIKKIGFSVWPSIKEIEGSVHFEYAHIKETVAEELAQAVCLKNHVHGLEFGEYLMDLKLFTKSHARIPCPFLELQEAVMRVLMHDSQRRHSYTFLNRLHLIQYDDTEPCEFIKKVKCLNALQVNFIRPLKVIEALKFNHGLEQVTFERRYSACYSINEDAVFSTIMDVLRVNYQLKEFRYPWENKYYAEALTMLFEERATNKPWEVMKDMVLVPSTSARLFFCGYPYAGKTTLKNTIVKNLRDKMNALGGPSKKTKISHNKLTKDVGTYSCDAMNTHNIYNRTKGIEVEAITTLNKLHLTMWDMAGHDAYHPFHDLVISNIDGGGSSCCFLLLCNLFEPENPMKRKGYIESANEIRYWLQFIASNTKKSIMYRPYVKLIFTGFDKVKCFVKTIKNEIERHMKPLQEQFKEILNINEQPFYVNAHDTESIQPMLKELEATLTNLLPTLPHVFEACEDLRKFLDEYKEMNPTHTLVRWEVFQAMCEKVSSLVAREDINFEVATKRREIVAISLHEAGEVIYYKDLNFVILDPHWFCHDVIGQVISCKDYDVLEPQMGVLPSTSLMTFLGESQLQEFDKDTIRDLLKLMMKLDLCIEDANDNILIPAALYDDENNPSDLGERQLSWLTKEKFDKGVHVGRRVAPVDTNCTMLTLGFFPRLQVSFQRLFEQNGYIIEKNMICFVWNEMEIILEYSGHIGFHIDIFIRSPHTNQSDVHEFLTNHIIKHIFQECSHPIRGCPGVILEESIIRPFCVKTLVVCKNRVNQIISVQMLKENIKMSNSLSFTHAWKQEKGVAFGYDKAMSLLSDTERDDVIGCFSKLMTVTKQSLMKLRGHESELTRPLEENDQDLKIRMEKMERNLMSTFKSTELVVMELYERQRRETQTLMESKLEDLILLVQNKFHEISSQSEASISNLSNKFQESLTFSVELEKTQCPKFVWFKSSKQQMKSKKKYDMDLRGTKYTVHILCETLIGNHMHEVENQQGVEIKVESESSAKFKKILKYTLITLSTLISIGAHVAAPGMGTLVPEIAKGFLLVLDTRGLLDRGFDAITPGVSNPHETILHANKEAKKWLEDLLRNQDIEDLFGLYKVKYKNCKDDINGRVAWICKNCKDHGDDQDKIDFLGCTLYS